LAYVLIFGAAGYGNLGDDAILEGTLAQLRGGVDAQFAAVGGERLGEIAPRLGIEALRHEQPRLWLDAIARADLALIGGGGLLYDSTFVPRLDSLLDPRSHWLYQCAKIAAAARTAGKRVALFDIGVGPLMTDAGRHAARFVAQCAEWITTRDEPSAELLVSLGIARARVQAACDPAMFLRSAPAADAARWLQGREIARRPRPWIALNARPWYLFPGSEASAQRRQGLYAALARFADLLAARTGGTIALLPLTLAGEDDGGALGEIQSMVERQSQVLLLDSPTDPGLLEAVVGEFDLLVGMRLHSLILAANAGTPFIALAYDPKVDAFAAAIEASRCFSIEGLRPEAVAEAAESALGQRDSIRAQMAAAVERVRAKGAVSVALTRAALEGEALTEHAEWLGWRPARSAGTPSAAPSDVIPRVLMNIRADWETEPGGDTVQLGGTKAGLEQLGVSLTVSTEAHPDLSEYDIVHAFNLTRPQEPLQHCENARRQGKPIVLSTVYWDAREFVREAAARIGLDPGVGVADELAMLAVREAQAAIVIEMADVLVPNAPAERDLLARNFGVAPEKCMIAPNAPSAHFYDATADDFVRAYGLRDFVLCVGRIELRKNQYALLAALKGTDLPIVIIGRARDERYLDLCRSQATDRVTFIGELPHERLPSAYAAARVHVLPSWYDTPGLVSLEAAAAGCNIVSTDRGSARDYFEDMAWYCSPDDLDSIRQATLAAWQAPKTERLREHVRHNFTWSAAAMNTLAAYRAALQARGRARPEQEAARQAAQVAAYQEYARALNETIALERADFQEYRQTSEVYVRSMEAHVREQEAMARRMRQELKALAREIEAITSRRFYRAGEWLALKLSWLRRRRQ
jgi:polysaccharide pyruvyl transferase CsaB